MPTEITLEARVQRAHEAYAAFQRRDDAALARLFATTIGWHESAVAWEFDRAIGDSLPLPPTTKRSIAEQLA